MQRTIHFKALVLAMASVGLVSLPHLATANPSGGQVVAGNATIHQETASKIGITQTTDKAIIDWQKFSIGANEHVQFYQPSASSVTLNRVVGQDPSQILGRLTANGQVFLVNPNGIYFGKNAQIDVAGLVASTHNIRNEDFMAGRYVFDIPGKPGASVINEGQIRVSDTGVAAFIAPSVANRGIIAAKLGKIALASANGFTLDFHGDDLVAFLVSDEVAKTAFDLDGTPLLSFVENSGKIEAQGGYVLLSAKAAENAIHSVINQSGVIEATSVGQQNGEIVLAGGQYGVVSNTGNLDASGKGAGETGGTVQVTGEKIDLISGTNIDVSGDHGGGKAIIGGDYLGGHAPDEKIAELGIEREPVDVQTSAYVTLEKDAKIIADAIKSGKGGKVVLWSDIHTIANGVISASGGSISGDGGFVETSGKESVDIRNIKVNASSIAGKSGTWLIDPASLTVDAATASSIVSSLNSGTNSTIAATDSVFIASDIIKSAGGNATFTVNSAWIYLQEGNDIKSTSGKLNVNFETTDRVWIGRGFDGGESNIISNGGNIYLHGPNFVGMNGLIDADSGFITVKAENKNSTGIDRGIWVFGSTVLRASKVSLLTEDTLRADAGTKFITTVVNAQTEAQVDQLTRKMEVANAPSSEAHEELGSIPNNPDEASTNLPIDINPIELSASIASLNDLLQNKLFTSIDSVSKSALAKIITDQSTVLNYYNRIEQLKQSIKGLKTGNPKAILARKEIADLTKKINLMKPNLKIDLANLKKLPIGEYLSALALGIEAVDLLAKTAAGQATIQDTEAPAQSAFIALTQLSAFKGTAFSTFGTALATVKSGVAAGEIAARIAGAMSYDDAHKMIIDSLSSNIQSSTNAGLDLLKMGRDGSITDEQARELAQKLANISNSSVGQITDIVENKMKFGSVFTAIVSGRLGKLTDGTEELLKIQQDISKLDYNYYYGMFKIGQNAAEADKAVKLANQILDL